ncbi:response regulator receiver protein (plasmid) [Calothrix sp. PCC 7716]|nr:response regulator receiver protein [Calothrix sp. PCC 7716]
MPSLLPNEEETLPKQPFQNQLSLNGLQVLVVDDNEDNLFLATFIFEQCQAKIKTATCVDKALEVIEEWQPDIIICDIFMPEKDGYALIRCLRDKEVKTGGFIPALALTSYISPETFSTAIDAGFQKIILKPFDFDELIAVAAHLIYAHRPAAY